MKIKYKGIFVLFMCIFMFSSKVYATEKVNSLNVNVDIDKRGNAKVVETWDLSEQSNKEFFKEFYDTNDAEVDSIQVHVEDNFYKESKNLKEDLSYYFKKGRNKQRLYIRTDGKKEILTIEYNVKGMITKFRDTEAINWYFLSSKQLDIQSLNIYITGPIEFNENNSALYAYGKNISCVFNEGKIHLFASKITKKTKIKIMASISDYKFKEYVKSNKKFLDAYESIKNKSFSVIEAQDFFIDYMYYFLIPIIIAFVLISILVHHFTRKKDYRNIKGIDHNGLKDMSEVDYFDSIPCNGDLYEIFFLANYYGIIKNKSNIIGAYILKWLLENKIILVEEKNKVHYKIKEKVKFDNKLDLELYTMLLKSSSNEILDKTKINRYVKSNFNEYLSWYNSVINEVINKEVNNKNIKVKKKKYYMNKKLYQDAKNILGLKKYLLNFNQVPRTSELNEENYKYLLIISVMLGINKSFSEEILRKNEDNKLGLLLNKFSDNDDCYKGIYELIKESKKNKKKRK